jgi:drug/metabolite transporter (DMT)-like permease
MLYLGLLSTMGCYLLQNVGQKYVPPNAASILLSTEAVFGALFSVIFLVERLTPRMLAGCVLIFAAIPLSGADYQKAESGLKPKRGQ